MMVLANYKVALRALLIATAFSDQGITIKCITTNFHQSRTFSTLRDSLLPK